MVAERSQVLKEEDMIDRIDKIKTFVLDMDGTIYLGNELFPYTKKFLNDVEHSGKNYYFFTNNSSKDQKTYMDKLAHMGIKIRPDQMMISNHVAIKYFKEYYEGKSLNYEKLKKACNYIQNGCIYFGMNEDLNCPMEGGTFIPDCGSMARLIEASTGRFPKFFGKPSKYTLDYIIKETGRKPEEIAIVGDRLYTDIAVADGSKVTSILVLSGESSREDVEKSDIKPDYIVKDLSEIIR